MSRSHGRFTVR